MSFLSNILLIKKQYNMTPPFNMFHVFAFTYYILLRCMMREYSMTSALLRDDIAIPFAIYRFHMAHNPRVHYEKLLDLRDVRVKYYYSLLERYMKHVFVAGLVTGDFFPFCPYPSKTNGIPNGLWHTITGNHNRMKPANSVFIWLSTNL